MGVSYGMTLASIFDQSTLYNKCSALTSARGEGSEYEAFLIKGIGGSGVRVWSIREV
jgi:hypothetical protein